MDATLLVAISMRMSVSGCRHCCVVDCLQAPTRKPGRPTLQRSGGAGAMTTAEVVAERRAALRLAKLEPGIGYWLAKQRWLWRHNRCGVALDIV